MKERLKAFSLVTAVIIMFLSSTVSAYWTPDWQVKLSTSLDDGAETFKDTYYLGAETDGTNGYSMSEDILKVNPPGWPDATYAGLNKLYVGMSSSVDGAMLGRDGRAPIGAGTTSWEIDLAANDAASGIQTFTWALTSVPQDIILTLKDYGSDNTRTNLVASKDLKSETDYAVAVTTASGDYRYLVIEAEEGLPAIIAQIVVEASDTVLKWNGISGVNYAIVSADDINGAWTVVTGSENIPGVDGTMTSAALDTSSVKQFYKVVALD